MQLNYKLCFVLLASAEQRENKREIRALLKEFAGEKLPGDDGAVAGAINDIVGLMDHEDVSISRCDRHLWAVSLFIYHAGGVILMDSVDWGVSIMFPGQSPIVITSSKQHELNQIIKHYEKHASITATANADHKTDDSVNVIVSSARFYDSLMFSFAIDQYLTTRAPSKSAYRNINLLLMKGMYYRDFDRYKDAEFVSVVEIESPQLKTLMDNPYLDKVQCIRLPHTSWRDIYRDRFMEYVRARSDECEKKAWPDKRYQILTSIELEKRRWREQEEALILLFQRLCETFGPLRVLVNGLTAPFGAPLSASYDALRDEEHEIVQRIGQSLASYDIEFHSLFGRALPKKISDILGSDAFFAPLGSACVVPAYLNIRGVAYGTRDFVADNRWLFAGLERVKIIDPTLVTRVQDDLSIMKFPWARAGSSGDSYSLDPQIAVQETLGFLVNRDE